MRKFKEDTKMTLHNYILQKRLLYARDLIQNETPITKASIECGFNDYSSFLRAFKKHFKFFKKSACFISPSLLY